MGCGFGGGGSEDEGAVVSSCLSSCLSSLSKYSINHGGGPPSVDTPPVAVAGRFERLGGPLPSSEEKSGQW